MRTRKSFKGQSLVEFALVFPIFFFLVTGLFDLGRAVFAYATMNNAAREGTRNAIVRPKTTPIEEIQGQVSSYFYDVQDFIDHTVIDVNRVGDEDNPKINIHLTYTFAPITPGLSHLLGEGTTLSIEAESEMYIAPIGK